MENQIYTSGSATVDQYLAAGGATVASFTGRHLFGSAAVVASITPAFLADGNYQVTGVYGYPVVLGSNTAYANLLKVSAAYNTNPTLGQAMLTNSISLQTSANGLVYGSLANSSALLTLAAGDQLFWLVPGGNASWAAGAMAQLAVTLQKI